MNSYTLAFYKTDSGKRPFVDWLTDLDKATRATVDQRLERIKRGNFGNHKHIEGNLYEFRFMNIGPGYRIYYALHEQTIILLLCGGKKSTQFADIQKAKQYLQE